jgi:hypothetical protein
MLKSIATSSLCITILASLAPITQAQSTTFSPKLPLSLQPQLQIPSFPKSSINSLPPKEPFLIKKIEVRGNTIRAIRLLQNQLRLTAM